MDEGSNRLQNWPALTSIGFNGSDRILPRFSVDTDPANATYPLTVDFYISDGSREGRTWIGSRLYTAADHASGQPVGEVLVSPVALDESDTIVATATDAAGNTSAFTPEASLSAPEAFVVTNTNDSGAGSLRQALSDASALGGLTRVGFDIPGSGTRIISPLSPLPVITGGVTIAGTTHPGATDCTAGAGGIPAIQIDGASAGTSASGLVFDGATGATVRGLSIVAFGGDGVRIDGGESVAVTCSFIGIAASGAARGNGRGVHLTGGVAAAVIGGLTAADRNVIGSNTLEGVLITGGTPASFVASNTIGTTPTGSAPRPNATGIRITGGAQFTFVGGTLGGDPAPNVISGNTGVGVVISASNNNFLLSNLIGTNADGDGAIPNGFHGVQLIGGASNNVIGGTGEALGNTISGNGLWGLIVEGVGTTGNRIQGNRIGVALDGTTPLGNARDGVLVYNGATDNTIGGTASGEGNVIAHNGESGVEINTASSVGNRILRNTIRHNAGISIDLLGNGTTPNDTGDADEGPNRLQNAPVFTSASYDGSMLS
ncbi:MAG: right-handed parallel beta-helix repeat-containing protein, partial [Bacteroidota bacterium]